MCLLTRLIKKSPFKIKAGKINGSVKSQEAKRAEGIDSVCHSHRRCRFERQHCTSKPDDLPCLTNAINDLSLMSLI